eukprot:jgi/Picsp_1/5217/NSC_02580-R1_15-hydroxyprostaglandin dehydrogenase
MIMTGFNCCTKTLSNSNQDYRLNHGRIHVPPPRRCTEQGIVKSTLREESDTNILNNSHAGNDDLNLPRTYRRLVARKTGLSFRDVAEVEHVELPDPSSLSAGFCLVKVKFAGVNGGCETFRSRGEYWFERNRTVTTFSLGAEGAGVVVAVGPTNDDPGASENIRTGDHVMFIGGAFSEYVTVKTSQCFRIDDTRGSSPEAVALRISGLVAYSSLTYVAGMKAGDTVLVTAGAGATGSYAVQYAKRAGCHVVATCRNEVKSRVLKERFGVDRVIDYSTEDVADVLSADYDGKIDIAYEGVGGMMQAAAWNSLAPGGRLMVVGYISEYPHASKTHSARQTQHIEMKAGSDIKIPLPPSDELFWQGKTYVHSGESMGSNGAETEQPKVAYGNVWPTDPELRQRSLIEAYRLQYGEEQTPVQGLIDPREFRGIESVADAVDYMLTGEAIGKVCISFD